MLATWADLQAIGAVPANEQEYGPKWDRAKRLLELASAQVVAYLRYDVEDDVTDALSAAQLTALSAVVAEIAAQRLNSSAAPSSPVYDDGAGWASAMMNRRHKRAIDEIVGEAGRRSMSVVVARDIDSSFFGSYLTDEAS